MTQFVARPHGVFNCFSFFYFFLKPSTLPPLYFHWNFQQCIQNSNVRTWNNSMYSKNKKEESTNIFNLYLSLAIGRATL